MLSLAAALTGLVLAWTGAILAYNRGYGLPVVICGVAVALYALWRGEL